jgi:hypothetical protein
MPICYDIQLNITRNNSDGTDTPTTLPFKYESDEPVELGGFDVVIERRWVEFSKLINDYDPLKKRSYTWGGGWTIISIYNC